LCGLARILILFIQNADGGKNSNSVGRQLHDELGELVVSYTDCFFQHYCDILALNLRNKIACLMESQCYIDGGDDDHHQKVNDMVEEAENEDDHGHDDGGRVLVPYKDAWKTMEDARNAIKTVLYRMSLPFYTHQSSRDRWELRCPRTKKEGVHCEFVVSAAKHVKCNDSIRITRSCLDHTCGCTMEGGYQLTISSKWASVQAAQIVRDIDGATPADIQRTLHSMHNVHASCYMATYRAQQRVLQSLADEEESSYQLIQPYFSKLKSRMPGTVTLFERDNENRLLRTFVLLAPLATALQSFKPVLSFDACHLKGKSGGTLMSATMKDGLGHLQVLAWGTAPIENAEHWKWFAENLRKGLPADNRHLTIFSDREKGIALALEMYFPECSHVYCMKHIERNIINKYRLRRPIKNAMWDACRALRQDDWERYMTTVVKQEDDKIYQYLLNIPWENKWATSYSTGPKWGENTSNASESANNWMEEVRYFSVLRIHTRLVAKCMQNMTKWHNVYSNMNTDLPPKISGKLQEVKKKGQAFRQILNGRNGWFLVISETSHREYEVYLGDPPACSCKTWEQTRFPCAHMAAAFFSPVGPRGENFERFIDPVYSTEFLRAGYSGIILPCAVDGDVRPDKVTLPPEVLPQAGRPKGKRQRSRGEHNPEESPITCSNCRQRGHNKRSCRLPKVMHHAIHQEDEGNNT
jgi:hypothetical protein